MEKNVKLWLKEHSILEVEAFVPDLTGIMRGKIMPCEKFLQGAVRMPESALAQTVTGDWGQQEEFLDETDSDMLLRPSIEGCFTVPWAREPTGQVVCDCVSSKGRLIRYAPRSVLKRVIRFYHEAGMTPIVAPELEFYLARRDNNPDNPLTPPVGRTGRPEFSSQPFNIDAVNEFEPIIEDIYRFAETIGLAVDTLTHEEGVAQFEINFNHGEALVMADQVMMFKRCVREAAINNGIVATFMAKPVEGQPGSSMHVHQSVVSRSNGKPLFAFNNDFSPIFRYYIGGLQHYLPEICAMLIPNINSFRRVNTPWPVVNNHWGINNRTVGLRVPEISSNPVVMRVENRVSGADANPYLAIAASLLAGFMGIKKKISPTPVTTGAAWDLDHRGIPLTLEDALSLMEKSKMLRDNLGNRFVNLYVACKRTELDNYRHVVTSWERKHLLDV